MSMKLSALKCLGKTNIAVKKINLVNLGQFSAYVLDRTKNAIRVNIINEMLLCNETLATTALQMSRGR